MHGTCALLSCSVPSALCSVPSVLRGMLDVREEMFGGITCCTEQPAHDLAHVVARTESLGYRLAGAWPEGVALDLDVNLGLRGGSDM